ncbi:MAG: hypothetical protein AABZ39_15575 [Spirochaetota bacterium]
MTLKKICTWAVLTGVLTSCSTSIMNVYKDPLFRIEYRIIRGENTCQPWGEVWDVAPDDVKDMDLKLCAYFKSRYTKDPNDVNRRVLIYFEKYRAQYCGFVRDRKKMIFCHLFLDKDDSFDDWKKFSEFAGLQVSGGAGTDFLYLIYDTVTKTFVDFWGKGS